MAREGIDASYSIPTGAELKAAGKTAAMLYVTNPGPGNKGITQALWDDYTAHGISIGFVWENGANATLNGRVQGIADAKQAQHNLSALNGPSSSRPIYFAIDFDASAAQQAQINAYFQGVNSVIGIRRTGAYGGFWPLSRLYRAGLIAKKWQTYAWSGGNLINPVDIYQYSNGNSLGSGQVDYDRFYSTNWGQTGVVLPKPTPKPVPLAVGTGLQVFVRDTSNGAIYSVGPEPLTLHHVTLPQWKGWKKLGYGCTSVPHTALTGYTLTS